MAGMPAISTYEQRVQVDIGGIQKIISKRIFVKMNNVLNVLKWV